MRLLIVGLAPMFIAACDGVPGSPGEVSRISFPGFTPASTATVSVPGAPPGGRVVVGGLMSVTVSMTVARDQPFAMLYVYLVENEMAETSCGINFPDTPSWEPFQKGTKTYTIDSFQLFRLPCEVIGLRAILHNRSNRNLLTVPRTEERLADATQSVRWSLRAAP
jgi:hypothetical protein